ncbi:outer envelope pore protein 16, chloroplastic-like isoform X2 [Malania oleifera]|uniref:outer envelope pore protein 16, chloroplastic-like isoform X2 n=1 Tax=Malania oleifera TaxID=397392 RepID=UPI0025AECD71|nr:outer envelope pore protein 16, chloroplastic-like isoform X2 [Malania oleifera]
MPSSWLSGSLSTPRVDVFVDVGNPFLNRTVDGFLKIGAVAAARAATEESYYILKTGNFAQAKFEHSLKKMCKEAAYWGTVAGVYVGMELGAERICGTRDWNAMIGGALTGALISLACRNKGDKIAVDAITGGAVATAAEFLNYLT